MNPRVLELLKNPKNIQSEDLNLLKEEIHAFPYVQNIRALHLYGVHLYDQENYQKELSTTAAYTTDKKILYQLINGKIRPESRPVETAEEKQAVKPAAKPARFGYKDKAFPIKREETVAKTEEKQDEIAACMLNIPQEVTHIYVNGERNRILFEGEENFLNEEHAETIDLESTLESGTLVTQKTEFVSKPVSLIQETVQQENEKSDAGITPDADTEFIPEEIVNEDQLSDPTEQEEIAQEDHQSFHEIERLEEIVDDEVNSEAKETISEEQEEAVEEAEASAEFTPEEIISEEQSSEEEVEEITEDNDISFHEVERLSPEAGQKENNIAEETPSETEQADDAEISFHGTESFMSDVKIQAANTEEMLTAEAVVKPSINKHEEEMRRLIEEVEKKMKETKPAAENIVEEPEAEDHEISFAETQNFHFWSTGSDEPKLKEETAAENIAENQEPEQSEEIPEEETKEPETTHEVNTAWKPMSVNTHVPDSLISKEAASPEVKTEDITPPEPVQAVKEEQEEIVAESSVTETETVQEDTEEALETAENEEESNETTSQEEEAPVMSVSFFGSDISSWSGGEAKNETEKEETAQNIEPEQPAQAVIDSNVPGFINTWQSWLKIDRTEDVEKEKTVIKEKAIETFIENNPRISQLKEESSYVVKERNDDISHLMTETLANLYFEQKLYSKAIKAFGILKKKHPEKAEYFDAKIKEVNDSKSGK